MYVCHVRVYICMHEDFQNSLYQVPQKGASCMTI